MQAAILYGKEDVRLEEVGVSPPLQGEVRVQVKAALTCGTDVKVYRRGFHARMIQPPALFGHEFSGVVEAVGPGAAGFRVGQRVTAANSAPCGGCYYCRKRLPEQCRDLLFLNGAYAEAITIPERIVSANLLSLPDSLSFEAGALMEPLACVVHGLDAMPVHSGETVAIVGLGPIGLMFVRLCALAGARTLAVGRHQSRLNLAVELGAEQALDEQRISDPISSLRALTEEGEGADKVIEAVGTPAAWEMCISMARRGGTVSLFGGCASGTSITLNTHRIHYDEIKLIGAFHHTPSSIRKALSLLDSGVIPAHLFIQKRIPLSELPSTLSSLASGSLDVIKVAVDPEA